MKNKKLIIVFGVLLVIVGQLGVFDSANAASFSIEEIKPSSIPVATETDIVLTLEHAGSEVLRRRTTFFAIEPTSIDLFVPNFPDGVVVRAVVKVTVPNDATLVRKDAILKVSINGTCAQKPDDCVETKLRITGAGTRPGGGGPGAPGGSGGSEFVEPPPEGFEFPDTGPGTGSDLVSLVQGITDWVFVVLLLVAVIFILLAAFQFIAGGGSSAAVTEARNKLIWAAVGIAVALVAKGIPFVIRNIVSGA